MEWVIAGAALLIIAAFIVATTRSARAPRSTPRADRPGEGTGAAIATGAIIGGVAVTASDDERVDDGGGGGGGDGGS